MSEIIELIFSQDKGKEKEGEINPERLFPPDVEFEEMVKMDGESMQSACQLNKHYREFCSKGNEEFWRAKYLYFLRSIKFVRAETWKELWIDLYREVRKDKMDKYKMRQKINYAVSHDDPTTLIALSKFNIDIKPLITKRIISIVGENVLHYLLSSVFTSEEDREYVMNVFDEYRHIDQDASLVAKVMAFYDMYFTADEYVGFVSSNISMLEFYIDEGIIDLQDIPRYLNKPLNLEEYMRLRESILPMLESSKTMTDVIVPTQTIENIFYECKLDFLNQLVNDGMSVNDLRRNISTFDWHDGPDIPFPQLPDSILIQYAAKLNKSRPGGYDECIDGFLSRLMQLGMTVEELNMVYSVIEYPEPPPPPQPEEEEGGWEIPFGE
uniref:Uncharacterized protein n=1 Tax=Marseillevirus LCMAC101 TaxID=2506602 RepID=A0A481YQA4_9VIRU|nr:MAG: hypothetical protein LCMAC101_00200 [Marseillevirus LCMAC101]